MARLGRLERPTSGSGDQRSIQLSYRRAARARRKRGRGAQETTARKTILTRPLRLRQSAFPLNILSRTFFPVWPPAELLHAPRSHPLARVLISLASFSISSAFLTRASESTWAESVFSTSSFRSLAS